MKSIGAMLKQLYGLTGTGDLTPWENTFVIDNYERTHSGACTTFLTEKVVAIIERLYAKHFGD